MMLKNKSAQCITTPDLCPCSWCTVFLQFSWSRMGYLGGSVSGCGSARQGSWLPVGFWPIPCVILGSRLKSQCYPRHVLVMADRWIQKQTMQAHLRPLFMLCPWTFQWSKKVIWPKSTLMWQGCIFHPQWERVGKNICWTIMQIITPSLRPACGYLRIRNWCSGNPLFVLSAIISFLFSLTI